MEKYFHQQNCLSFLCRLLDEFKEEVCEKEKEQNECYNVQEENKQKVHRQSRPKNRRNLYRQYLQLNQINHSKKYFTVLELYLHVLRMRIPETLPLFGNFNRMCAKISLGQFRVLQNVVYRCHYSPFSGRTEVIRKIRILFDCCEAVGINCDGEFLQSRVARPLS